MTNDRLVRLLVVDDEPEILSEVSGYLRRRGELVVTASSYGQAMLALNDEAAPIDILITDARMPDGNGVDLTRLAVERPEGPHAYIIMTGHMEESDLAADLQEAGVKIIYKPFSLAVFYREVRSACEGTRANEQPRELDRPSSVADD